MHVPTREKKKIVLNLMEQFLGKFLKCMQIEFSPPPLFHVSLSHTVFHYTSSADGSCVPFHAASSSFPDAHSSLHFKRGTLFCTNIHFAIPLGHHWTIMFFFAPHYTFSATNYCCMRRMMMLFKWRSAWTAELEMHGRHHDVHTVRQFSLQRQAVVAAERKGTSWSSSSGRSSSEEQHWLASNTHT